MSSITGRGERGNSLKQIPGGDHADNLTSQNRCIYCGKWAITKWYDYSLKRYVFKHSFKGKRGTQTIYHSESVNE